MLVCSNAEVRLNPYVAALRLVMVGALLIGANLWHVTGDTRADCEAEG